MVFWLVRAATGAVIATAACCAEPETQCVGKGLNRVVAVADGIVAEEPLEVHDLAPRGAANQNCGHEASGLLVLCHDEIVGELGGGEAEQQKEGPHVTAQCQPSTS